jgi:hypothetical protein
LDWKKILESGKRYEAWLEGAEFPDHRTRMVERRAAIVLDAVTRARLKAIKRPVHVVCIAEDWCGDVVRHVPVLEAMATTCPEIQTRYISRDQYPDVFARYLTNGGEAIPKFVFVTDNWVEVGNWGPMPNSYKPLIARGKSLGDVGPFRKRISALCEADPHGEDVVADLIALVEIAGTPS